MLDRSNRSTSSFGETRKFNGKIYSLESQFKMITKYDCERFGSAVKELRLEGKKVRTITNHSGQKAIYVLSEDE